MEENQTNTIEEPTLIQELIKRYNQRLKTLWSNSNPYYKKGELPTEYQDLKKKINELEKQIKNNDNYSR